MTDVSPDVLVHIKVYQSGSTGELSSPITVFHCVAMICLLQEHNNKFHLRVIRSKLVSVSATLSAKPDTYIFALWYTIFIQILSFKVDYVEVIVNVNLFVCCKRNIIMRHPEGSPLFHSVFNILQSKKQGAMDEAYETFISRDESCDSLESRFSGLSVLASFTLKAWMTGLRCRGGGVFM